jgi:hypothetical protein
MKDFNIAKYLRENHLGSHAILGAYVNLHALKEAEDLEGLEVVKGFGALKDKKLADKYAEVAKQAGMEDVKVIERDGVFKIYAKAGQKLNKEEEMELDTEIPYEGPENKLDGFGDEFEQDKPVQELEKPEKIYSNDWMNNSIDDKRVGNWACYYTDQMGTIYWVHDDIPGEHIMVYATPNWDGAKGIAIEVQVDYGEHTLDQEVVGDPSYPDFESYAQDMIPVLNKVESKYKSGKYHDYIDYGDSMDTDDSVNPFPSIMKEKEDSMIFDKGWQYDDDEDEVSNDDRFADLGGDQIKSAIKSLMDDGFDSREIAQFVVDTIRFFKSFKEEVTVSSSGVQMEKK